MRVNGSSLVKNEKDKNFIDDLTKKLKSFVHLAIRNLER